MRAEGALRTIYLYPHAMSFIVTGLVWQWFLNPTLGLQKLMHDAGWQSFTFDWLVNKEMVVYTLVIAGLWQSAGLIMAILLAGLRGVDEDLWKAARVDGIPTWRVYVSIVLPILRPMLITVDRPARDRGGQGLRPRGRDDQGRAGHRVRRCRPSSSWTTCSSAPTSGSPRPAATFMLVTVIAVLAPWLYSQYGPPGQGRAA